MVSLCANFLDQSGICFSPLLQKPGRGSVYLLASCLRSPRTSSVNDVIGESSATFDSPSFIMERLTSSSSSFHVQHGEETCQQPAQEQSFLCSSVKKKYNRAWSANIREGQENLSKAMQMDLYAVHLYFLWNRWGAECPLPLSRDMANRKLSYPSSAFPSTWGLEEFPLPLFLGFIVFILFLSLKCGSLATIKGTSQPWAQPYPDYLQNHAWMQCCQQSAAPNDLVPTLRVVG